MRHGYYDNKIEVLIPEYPFNIDEETGNIDLYDDDDEQMLASTLLKEYNISVSTMELPLI